MSLLLCCPNCGAEVGTADREDGYKHHFHYINDEGEPYCKNCGTGKYIVSTNGKMGCLLFVIVGIIMIVLYGLYGI